MCLVSGTGLWKQWWPQRQERTLIDEGMLGWECQAMSTVGQTVIYSNAPDQQSVILYSTVQKSSVQYNINSYSRNKEWWNASPPPSDCPSCMEMNVNSRLQLNPAITEFQRPDWHLYDSTLYMRRFSTSVSWFHIREPTLRGAARILVTHGKCYLTQK